MSDGVMAYLLDACWFSFIRDIRNPVPDNNTVLTSLPTEDFIAEVAVLQRAEATV